jgi:hypothetical protein
MVVIICSVLMLCWFSKIETLVNGLSWLHISNRATSARGRVRRSASDAVHSTNPFAKISAPFQLRNKSTTNRASVTDPRVRTDRHPLRVTHLTTLQTLPSIGKV